MAGRQASTCLRTYDLQGQRHTKYAVGQVGHPAGCELHHSARPCKQKGPQRWGGGRWAHTPAPPAPAG